MTNKQALRKAKMLFGKTGVVEKSHYCTKEEYIKRNPKSGTRHFDRFFGKDVYKVGRIEYGFAFMVLGQGLSWEEAFEEATKKEVALV